jgi:hypothetical protein
MVSLEVSKRPSTNCTVPSGSRTRRPVSGVVNTTTTGFFVATDLAFAFSLGFGFGLGAAGAWAAGTRLGLPLLLRVRLPGIRLTPTPPQGPDAQTNALLQDYERAVSSGDAAAQLAITLALQTQVMDQRLEERFKTLEPKLEGQSKADRDIAFEIAQDRVAKGYGDQWADLQPDVQKWLHEHSAWLPTTNSPEAFENVIREAAKTVVNEKAAEQLAALNADRAAKLTAQTATGSGQGRYPTQTDDKKQAWEEVKNADVGSYGQMRGNG